MNYRLIRNVKSKSRFLPFGTPILFLMVIALFHFIYPGLLGSLVSRIALPFWNIEQSVGEEMNTLLAYFSSKATLEAEVGRLSEELLQARSLLLDRDLLVEENEMLKEQFGRTPKDPRRIIGAVLVAPPRSPYDSVVLDVGSVNGIAIGDFALRGSSVLGTVSRVYAHTSTVTFFSTAGTKTPVLILREGSALPVEGSGQGGGEFIATVPKEASVRVGDRVVMPGLNPLLFATVEAIESSVTDSFDVVRFRNPVSFANLRVLEIEKRVVTTE